MRTTFKLIGLILALVPVRLIGDDRASSPEPAAAALEARFNDTVRPFLTTYCVECHGREKPKGDLNLADHSALDSDRWEAVQEQLETGTMPPSKAKRHPEDGPRREVIAWIRARRTHEAKRNAGDPGPVLARRLSNAEYDHTVRDLTGVDIRPTREFPVDPANEAGFDNSAESLTMSPALVKKYLEAARRVADHLVLKPRGLAFASHPMIADTDRDKYCVRRIIDFYRRQRTDYADYFLASWRHRHRAALGAPGATLPALAAEAGLSPRYLETIWATLSGPPEETGPIAALQAMWRELPPPSEAASTEAVRAGCERMRDFAVRLRQELTPEVKNLTAPGIHNGSQCFVLWKNRQYAANRRRYAGGATEIDASSLGGGEAAALALAPPKDPAGLPAYEAAFARFCSTFPDAFFVSERARVYLNQEKEKQNAGRLLSAGFHSMTGYFRDDAPLSELLLDEAGRRELDALWEEFDFITAAPLRQYSSFLWFERTDSRYMRDPEFDFARAEDKDAASEEKIRRLAEVYRAKARREGASDVALGAIADHFRIIDASIRRVERGRLEAEPSHVEALRAFAERAYRRPLSGPERDDIAAFYRTLREAEGLGHEDAVRDTVVSVLMSPHFCYRIDRPESEAEAGTGIRPLSDYALASRLSYFLWSS